MTQSSVLHQDRCFINSKFLDNSFYLRKGLAKFTYATTLSEINNDI